MRPTRNGAGKGVSKAAQRATAAMESATEGMTERVRQYADQAIAGVEDQFEAVQETTAKYLQEGREAATNAGSLMAGYVRSHPLKALTIAASAGILLSMFLRRR